MSGSRRRALFLVSCVLLAVGGQLDAQPIQPSIVINNDTGANPPAASGAPELFGPVVPASLCATAGASTTIQSPGHGLGAVPTNGSAVVWMETASGRRWSRITGVPNGDTFTVEDSFNIAAAVPCVVGGAIAGTLANLTRLCSDVKSGWTVTLENTGIDYTDSGTCALAATSQSPDQGRLVIRGNDPDNLTRILWQTNGNYLTQATDPALKLENIHLVKDTAAGTAGQISTTGWVFKNIRVSNSQGTWLNAWGSLSNAPALVLSSQFNGPFTGQCAAPDSPDLIMNNYLDGCSGSAPAIVTNGAVLLHNIIDQQGANQVAASGSVNNGFGGVLLYNTFLNVGASAIQIGTNASSIVSGNLVGEASTLSGACFLAGTGAVNHLGVGGEAHILWQGNAANICPTARYGNGLDTTPFGAATDIDAGAQFDPLFQDAPNLDFFPTYPRAKSNTVFPGISFPLLTPAAPQSTMTVGAPQRPGGSAGAYAY